MKFIYVGPVYSTKQGVYLGEFQSSTEANSKECARRKLQYKAYLKFNQWVDFINPVVIKSENKFVPVKRDEFIQTKIKF